MAGFISGLIKGGVVAAIGLGAASVLLSKRPGVAPKVQITSQDTASPEAASPDAASPVVAPQVTTPPKVDAPKVVEPVVTPAIPQEALLDPPTQDPPAQDLPESPDNTASPLVTDPIAEGSKTLVAPKTIETAPVETAPAPVIAASGDAAPLIQYAARFDNPGTKPLFAVILFDTGGDLDRAALAALPFPVTFALDPADPNAPAAMAIYRAAGKEVVMMVADLPATAQEMEQNFQAFDLALPETVAIMGPAKGGFQDNGVLANLVVPAIAAQGRGLITFDRGLNSVAQVALRSGLPSGKVFRQVDGGGESMPVIRRYLDRAVFKAAQEGSAIVMGQTNPDTIQALTEWTVQGRASEVTLAPVSALLR